MNHYIPYQIVVNYINRHKISQEEKELASKLCIKHLSGLA